MKTYIHHIIAEWEEQEARQMIMQCRVRISVLSVTLRNAIYSSTCRKATTIVCVGDHKVHRNGVECRKEEEAQGS